MRIYDLTEEQIAIIKDPSSIVVSASAGDRKSVV
mgnify:CR=1 FL=1